MNFKTTLLAAALVLAAKPVFAESGSATGVENSKPSTSAQAGTPTAGDSTSAHPRAALQGPALFKLIDTNKDGRISLDEFVAYGKAANPSSGSEKTSAVGEVSSKSGDSDQTRRTKDSPPYHKAGDSNKKTNAVPEPDSPGPSLLPSVSTRADKFTAEVFANLDIDHDKFLSQAELDALIGAHQISQP